MAAEYWKGRWIHDRPDEEENMNHEFIYRKILSKVDIFWSLIDKSDSDSCWPWLGFTDKDGYGRLPGGETIGAHRAAWMIHFGPITSKEHVLHRCDNPPCCNPHHLFIGDHSINHADKVRKGRQSHGEKASNVIKKFHKTLREREPDRYQRIFIERVRGENNPTAKLSEDDVREIRTCGGLQREVAARFGVQQTVISAIRLRKTWKHVT
jgi:hypothetical protein